MLKRQISDAADGYTRTVLDTIFHAEIEVTDDDCCASNPHTRGTVVAAAVLFPVLVLTSLPPKELAPLVGPSTPPSVLSTSKLLLLHTSKQDLLGQFLTPDIALMERRPVYTASHSSSKSTLLSPRSVDERVPPLPTTPCCAAPAYPLKSDPLGQTTALIPSSSRCTLIIPLLGCAKVPLGICFEKKRRKVGYLFFFLRF